MTGMDTTLRIGGLLSDPDVASRLILTVLRSDVLPAGHDEVFAEIRQFRDVDDVLEHLGDSEVSFDLVGERLHPGLRDLTRFCRLENLPYERVVGLREEAVSTTWLPEFETEMPSWEAWNGAHLPAPRLVAERDGTVVGWVAVSRVSRRPAYRGVVEHSIYVDAGARGSGVGRTLMEALVAEAPDHDIWTIQTSVIEANQASLRLHAAQ